MKVEVLFRGIEQSEALKNHVRKRAELQLGRFRHEIAQAIIRIADVNGPRGGLDKRCLVSVEGAHIPTVTVVRHSDDPYLGVDDALKRLARVVARRIDMKKSGRRAG